MLPALTAFGDEADIAVLYMTAEGSSWVAKTDGHNLRLRKGRQGAVRTIAQAWEKAMPDKPLALTPTGGACVSKVESRGTTLPPTG